MKKTAQAATVLLIAALSLSSSRPLPTDYIAALRALKGTPYLTLDCARYIEAAKGSAHCGGGAISGADGMWDGCSGKMEVIATFATKRDIDVSTLRAGDVLDFHGAHVIAFVGDGFMDSDPSHGGVGRMDPRTTSDSDRWFAGPVRVIRWK